MADDRSSGIQLQPRTVGAIVLVLLAVVFVVQNRDEGRIDFLWWRLEVGMWLALTATFVVGLAAGWLIKARAGD